VKGKGENTGQARAFALTPPKKRIPLPRGKGLKGWGVVVFIKYAKTMDSYVIITIFNGQKGKVSPVCPFTHCLFIAGHYT
jgi:hypothetical protein